MHNISSVLNKILLNKTFNFFMPCKQKKMNSLSFSLLYKKNTMKLACLCSVVTACLIGRTSSTSSYVSCMMTEIETGACRLHSPLSENYRETQITSTTEVFKNKFFLCWVLQKNRCKTFKNDRKTNKS